MEDMGMNGEFWNGKRVFMTGHTGFKGSWLSLWLERLGASLSGYALAPPSLPNLFEATRVGETASSTFADVRDLEQLCAAMRDAEPEIVYHLAAQPLVRASYEDPAATYAVNVMGTVNFLEAVRRTPSVRVAVIITSDKSYENKEWWWGYRETDPMGGSDPYSSSKGCAELVTQAYRRSFLAAGHVAVATARAGNVIGGGDWAEDRLFPDIVRAFIEGRTLRLRYPQAVRPWQHVLEPLRGYLTLGEHLWNGGAAFACGWNFGPGEEDAKPVEEVVRRAARHWGGDAQWQADAGNHLHEAHYLKLDCSQARLRLGWAPVIDLAAAVEWTTDWYKAHHSGAEDMRLFSLNQIAEYEQLVYESTRQLRAV